MKEKIKKIMPYILIVIAVSLLTTVLVMSLQFYYQGQNIQEEQPQEMPNYELINESNLTEDDIMNLIVENRDKLVLFFNQIPYYKISTIDESYTESQDEIFMVLTNEFTDELASYTTAKLYQELTKNFEVLKKENDTIYYKVLKTAFNNLHNTSAIAIYNYTNLTIYPTYASESKINCMINIQLCEEKNNEECRRNEYYKFEIIKENGEWKINDIGIA